MTTHPTTSRAARTTAAASGAERAQPAPRSLDELAALSLEELGRLYEEAPAPESLESLAGRPAGRMLAAIGPLDRPGVRRALARVARSRAFPWRGKTFEAFEPTRGEGINRVRILGERYRFGLGFGTSALDGRPCVVLDYDRSDNPWPIRQIRDELRELTPGLLFGPALLTTGREPRLMLFFAVDARG